MECPMCWELYNQERIARNLLCGHTYCQVCLEKIFITKRRIECPMCRHKHDPSLKVTSLSRNYVAMELASKHIEVAKKL
jgi:kelch-like protein 10